MTSYAIPTIGRDCSLVLIWAGDRIDMNVTDFRCRQVVERMRHHPLNADPMEYVLPKGWEGEFALDRRGPEVERLFYQIEYAFRTGGGTPWWVPGPAVTTTDPTTGRTVTTLTGDVTPGKLYQYVTERNGGTTTYEFVGFTMVLEDAGNYRSADVVRQRISFFASARNEL